MARSWASCGWRVEGGPEQLAGGDGGDTARVIDQLPKMSKIGNIFQLPGSGANRLEVSGTKQNCGEIRHPEETKDCVMS